MIRKPLTLIYVLIALLFLFLGCQTEELSVSNTKQDDSRKVTTVSFQTFKSLTGLADFQPTFRLPQNRNGPIAQSKSRSGYTPADFIIDTKEITQTIAGEKTSYVFPITPVKGEIEDKRFYLVVYNKDGKWLEMIIQADYSVDKDGDASQSGFKEIYASSGRGLGCTIIYSWVLKCNREGKCASGVCDKCSICLRGFADRICPPINKQDYLDGGFTKPDGNGGGGGGGSSNPNPNPDPDDTEVIGTFPILENPRKECDKVKKLASDILFRQKMNNLEQATNYRFEKIFTGYPNPDPNSLPRSDFKFLEKDGVIGEHKLEYGYFYSLVGIMHSHYEGLLSVYSADDLFDLYQKMKDYRITDDFFFGLVTKSGTRYLITISDREKFIAFGDKYLSTPNKMTRLINNFYIMKYNIASDNTATENEKGFVKMATELKMGVAIFSGNSDFTQWKRLTYANNQVNSSTCN